MALRRLVPTLLYKDVSHGLKLFVTGLRFSVTLDVLAAPQSFCIVERDGLRLRLEQNDEFANDRPEIAIETDDIDGVYAEVTSRTPELLHPNLREVTLRSWGAREFALLDESGVCVILRQW